MGRSKGRERAGRYFGVPHDLMRTVAWGQLSSNSRAAWLEFCLLHNGFNNGRIAVSARFLAARLRVAPDTSARAIRELLTLGFIEITRGASFSGKRRAAEYRLTHLKDDRDDSPPNRTYQNIAKLVQDSQKLSGTVNGEAKAKTVSDPSDNIDLNFRTRLVRPIGL